MSTRKETKRRKRVGRKQLDNVAQEREMRELAERLRERGINPDQSTKALQKLLDEQP